MIRSYELLKKEKDKLEYALGVLRKEVGSAEWERSTQYVRGRVE